LAAKVIQFPAQIEPNPAQPNLADIEKRIRATLAALTADSQLIEHVTARMMVFIKKYTFKNFEPSFTLPVRPMSKEQTKAFLAALADGMRDVAGQVQDMMSQIVIERLFLEIEIYENARGSKNTSVLGRFPAILDVLPQEYREKVNYIVNQLKRANLKPQEKYLLNILLRAVIEEKMGGADKP